MSSTKDKYNLSQPLFFDENPYIGLEDCKSLHAHTRKAEQALNALNAQKNIQGDVKPKETKK